MIGTWNAPLADAKHSEELIVSFDSKRDVRVLVLPALFDEANKLRRFTCEVMRQLDAQGIDTFLPDLPGMNESTAPLAAQTIAFWNEAASAALDAVAATHVLALRGGGLIADTGLPGWLYAPTTGAALLKTLIRARMIASKEAGETESSEAITREARRDGTTLAGWDMSAEMFRQLETAVSPASPALKTIDHSELGGKALWLRAEPDDDADQSGALAQAICADLAFAG
ncbi:hypothetical protein [Erythrobacter sp. MTPC3]|uniref:hypothetical protein n=1 Tax=Erythrobacter sp. MTPC3 TaxID=3056564 RepID=UPI0036F1E77C